MRNAPTPARRKRFATLCAPASVTAAGAPLEVAAAEADVDVTTVPSGESAFLVEEF